MRHRSERDDTSVLSEWVSAKLSGEAATIVTDTTISLLTCLENDSFCKTALRSDLWYRNGIAVFYRLQIRAIKFFYYSHYKSIQVNLAYLKWVKRAFI